MQIKTNLQKIKKPRTNIVKNSNIPYFFSKSLITNVIKFSEDKAVIKSGKINESTTIKAILFLSLLSLFILFSGCIKRSQPLSSYLSTSQVDYLNHTYSSVNNCTAMVCDYKSKLSEWWDQIQHLFSQPTYLSLVNKKCSFQYFDFDNLADMRRLDKLTGKEGFKNDTTEFIQPVMIGVGDSVYTGDKLFEACQGHLGINMIDISSLPKDLKSDSIKKRYKKMNECILESGTIPFYKYGRLQGSAALLAEVLDGTGPVFVSPGFGYNISKFDPNIVSPHGSFYLLKKNCDNCLVVATVNYGDFATLKYYNGSRADWENIDVIAFIANISSFSSCEPLFVIKGNESIKSFAQNITETYSKPVIVIVYGNEGYNPHGNCTWTNTSLAKFYDYLIRYIPDLVSSGVIAVISADSSQLPIEAYNSLGLFCTIYYSTPTPKFNFASYSLFSMRGDVPSLCNYYNLQKSMFMLGDVINYSNITLTPTKKEESCVTKLFYDLKGVSPGRFSSKYCDNDDIFNLASKYFLDVSLYMAVLDKLGYSSSSISGSSLLKEPHCSKKCDQYKEKDLCCVAETMAYYQNKTINKKPNINDVYLAYFIAYGTIRNESRFDQELNKFVSGVSAGFSFQYSAANEHEKKESAHAVFLSSHDSDHAEFQDLCTYYFSMCRFYQSTIHCMLYDEYCRSGTYQPPGQQPGQPPWPSEPTPPSPEPEQPPMQPTPPTGPSPPSPRKPSPPSFQMDMEIEEVLRNAVAARTVCNLK